MFNPSIIELFLYFIIYSFLGYIAEIIYCFIAEHKLVNRGFFYGPYCPIYGVGAILVSYALTNHQDAPVIVFCMGVLITLIVEYYTSYILEKIFHNKWWDYSNRLDSINGRVCLGNGLLFGLGTLIIIYLVNPLIDDVLTSLNPTTLLIITIVLGVIFIIDLIASITIAYNLRHRLIIAEELKAKKIKMLPLAFSKSIKKQLAHIKKPTSRLLTSFPYLKETFSEELDTIKKWVIKNAKRKK